MTRNKDFKRLVRTRMRKTGESYTAARAQMLRRSSPPLAATPGPAATPGHAATPGPVDYARIAGMSDATIKAKTGCAWDKWVKSLDHHGAAKMAHRDIAALIRDKYKTSNWWTQTVAVGYERIRGLRATGQRRDGTFSASKSRTFPVPVARLYDAWATPAGRRRWLKAPGIRVRTATRPRSMRLDGPNGGIVAVGFAAKGPGRSSVAVQQDGLATRADAERIKAEWASRLDALGAALAAG
ncbi:MAG: hypothetical protein U9Q74_05455 [Gemmatimonadota bacterium]|nr:hypothetical protein [Gemmatimonadota bacterium]